MWEMLCRERDLQRKRRENEKSVKIKNAEINNVVYMGLYSGPKKVNEKDLKTKYLRSKYREFTVYMELLVNPEILTWYIYRPTFGNAERRLFLFAAKCFNTESMQKVIL
jgi:hypothetical protein